MTSRILTEFISNLSDWCSGLWVWSVLILFVGFGSWLLLKTNQMITEASGAENTIRLLQSQSYVLLSTAIHYVLEGFAVIAMLLGGMSVAMDQGSGRLRYLLSQPVRRTEFLIARILNVTLLLLVGLFFFLLFAFLVIKIRLGFGPAVDPDYPSKVIFSRGTMLMGFVRLLLIGMMPLLATAMLGLLISINSNHGTTAIMVSLFGYFILRIVGTYPAEWVPSYFFLGTLEQVTFLARNLGDQVTTAPSRIRKIGFTHPMVWNPIAYTLSFGLFSWYCFQNRDIR